MDKIRYVKLEQEDGTYSNAIPLSVNAEYVKTEDGESIEDKLNKKPYYFDTVADMKASTDLKEENVVITLGYYEINDGGGAEYKIRTKLDTDIDDGFKIIIDNLVAELIIKDNTVNIKQLGARSQNSNNQKYDIKSFLLAYMNYLDTISYRIKLYIPSGV